MNPAQLSKNEAAAIKPNFRTARRPRATLSPTSTSVSGFSQISRTTGFFDSGQLTTFTSTVTITSSPFITPITSTVVCTITAPRLSTNSPFPPSLPASTSSTTSTSPSPSFGSRNLTPILLGSILGTTTLLSGLLLLILCLRRRTATSTAPSQLINTAESAPARLPHRLSPLSFTSSNFVASTLSALDRSSRHNSNRGISSSLEVERPVTMIHPNHQFVASVPYSPAPASFTIPNTLFTPCSRSTRGPQPEVQTLSDVFYTPSSTRSSDTALANATPTFVGIPFPSLTPEPMRFGDYAEEESTLRSSQEFLDVPGLQSRWSATETDERVTPDIGRWSAEVSSVDHGPGEVSRWSADTPSTLLKGGVAPETLRWSAVTPSMSFRDGGSQGGGGSAGTGSPGSAAEIRMAALRKISSRGTEVEESDRSEESRQGDSDGSGRGEQQSEGSGGSGSNTSCPPNAITMNPRRSTFGDLRQ
ncbi:hypothetical protein P7C70_g4449, partial [Phenoliferia sp. Uapishka_3]